MKKELKHHFMSLEEKYKMPTSFQLTLLHPYLAYLKSNVTENDNNCLFGFADTQNAICTAFVYDTIPYMKTIERMTNPCFQEAPFASVMKGRHVLNEPDEADLDSDHVEEFSGQAKGGDREREATRKRKRNDPPLQCSGDGPTHIERGGAGSNADASSDFEGKGSDPESIPPIILGTSIPFSHDQPTLGINFL